MPQYFVYILCNSKGTLYIGVTNDVERRLGEHKNGLGSQFTSKYGVSRLVYCEAFPNARDAIAHEKRLKGWTRVKKIALIDERNPAWVDLTLEIPSSWNGEE
jgi:putative endonuclease